MEAGTVVSFSPLEVENTYEHWRARLAEANNPDFIPITFIDKRVSEGSAIFLANADAAIVIEVLTYPGGAKAASVLAAAGDKATILGDLTDKILGWAKAAGLTHAMVPGRVGWKRELPDFFHYQTILVKEL